MDISRKWGRAPDRTIPHRNDVNNALLDRRSSIPAFSLEPESGFPSVQGLSYPWLSEQYNFEGIRHRRPLGQTAVLLLTASGSYQMAYIQRYQFFKD